jgi:hypothetical protein
MIAVVLHLFHYFHNIHTMYIQFTHTTNIHTLTLCQIFVGNQVLYSTYSTNQKYFLRGFRCRYHTKYFTWKL